MSNKLPIHKIALLLLLALSLSAYPQSVDIIKNSGYYYWGIGTGSNFNAARRNALENLSESISVQVQSDFEQVVRQVNGDLTSHVKSVVRTYSSAVLDRYETRSIKDEPGDSEVLVYITRQDLNLMFQTREQMIRDFIHQAQRAEREYRIADALRYYYWALVLNSSHRDNVKLRHIFEGNQEESMIMGINDRIRSIFSFLDFTITGIREQESPPTQEIHLSIKYHNHPVQDIDYSYWLGDGYASLVHARNGIGAAILTGEAARNFDRLRIRIEYQYFSKAGLVPEVELMLNNVELPYFERSEIHLPLKESIVRPIKQPTATGQPIRRNFEVIGTYKPEYNTYRDVVEYVVQGIRDQNHESQRQWFSDEGYEMYQKLIGYGNVTVLDRETDTFRIVRVGDEVMVRSVPMLFAFRNNRERFIESVVFSFNNQNKINSISFSLGQIAIDDILSRPERFGSYEDKYFLIRFMEDYKTAYSLERLDYLKAIFDENALIIVGNVVKRSPEPVENVRGMYGNLSEDQVEYIWLNKSEYMERLKMVFNRNEFINIHFEDNQVRKTEKNEKIYGIQIAQHYYSSTYADKGYLFLMIDLNDTINPKIYVRTWQPQKNPDGSIFGLEDFRF